MLKESLNNSNLSPKKSDCFLLEEYRRELEQVKRALETERIKAQDARQKFNSEQKNSKEYFEREKNKIVDDLNSKWQVQVARELQQFKESIMRERESEIKQLLRWKEDELRELKTILRRERDVAVRQARELQKQLIEELLKKGYTGKPLGAKRNKEQKLVSDNECHCKLQDVLSKLRWDYDGEQAALIRHLKIELDLKKNLYMKCILENSKFHILFKENLKPSHDEKQKYGRHSLGSNTLGPRSLNEFLFQPQLLHNTAPTFHEKTMSPSRSFECLLKRSIATHSSTMEQYLKNQGVEMIAKPALVEAIITPRIVGSTDDPSSEGTFSNFTIKDDTTWLISYKESYKYFQQANDQFQYIYQTTSETGGNNETSSTEGLKPYQLLNLCDKSVDTSQLLLNDSENSQSKQDEEMLNTLRALEQRCNALNEENIMLRKGIFPETEEKVKRLKKKNTELALIAKRLEERAQKLQEANLKMVSTPVHLKGVGLEVCKKAYARQRAKDMSDQASALLAKDKQIETLKQECRNLQAKLSTGKEFPSWLKLSDFERLLRESQKEVLRLQRQIAVKFLKDSLQLSKSSSRNHLPNDAVCINSVLHSDQSTDDEIKESELRTKRKECEILEQEVKKKQKRCEALESKLQEVQTENVRLVEENSRLSDKINWTIKVECENADLRDQLFVVTEQRDSALKESLRLQTKLENLEQVLKHMRNVVERRQQLKKDHEDAVISLQKRQEEVKRLQQAQVEAKKEHEGAVHLLENTLDNLQAKVKLLEEKCRSQTEQFSLLSQELERFRLQTGNIDLLTSTLVTSELPPPQCCSTPGVPCVHQDNEDDSWDKEKPVLPKLEENSKNEESTNNKSSELSNTCCKSSDGEVQRPAVAKEKEKSEPPRTPSKSESTHESRKSCPTPEVDTASEMEELEADSVSLIPDSVSRSSAKLQVFLARYSYNPFDGPNENPEAELPLTAGEYIYIYGDMDDDGFYEGELMDGRRGLVPSNFVERVSDDDLMAFQPVESNELSQSSGQDISFLSGSSIEKSEEDEDESSLSPCQGNSEGASDVSAVPYPRKLTLIKQLAHSVVVSWDPPLVAAGSANIQSYNIFVDHELRQNVRCGGQTKALIEKLELKTRTYRISVQSMTEKGGSDRMRCTMLIGYGYSLAPTQLRVRSLSATSAEITWQPCNSNYSHALHLNEESCGFTKPGTYWFSFASLRPSSIYNIKVEARPQRIPWEMPLERREQKSTVMQLTTPCAGPPDAPLDVQVELGPTPGVLLISWLPVTIDAAGTSNGVRVTGYAVYADGQKVLEVTSPTAGSVLVGMSHLQLLHVSREITVRTMSPSGESVDSVPANIPSALLKVPDFDPFLQPLSNTSLICEPASGHSFDTCSEKSPLMPLKLFSSPHLLPSPSSEAKFSNDANGRQGEAIDSLSAGVSTNQVLTTINAPSCFSQESSISECSDVLQHCIKDKGSPLTPQSMEILPLPTNSHNLDVYSILLNERETKLHEEHMNILNAKEPAVHEFKLQKALTEDRLPELCTSSMEDIPSKETVKVEEAIDSRVNLRGNSIEEFLEGAGTDRKESDKTELKSGLLENHETSHVEHSRSSNLSDILEEEEDDDDDCNIASSETKWQLSMGGDAPGKLDCCETDSDEEILERILDLPLQKQCSKKLFSIPEVTEEEEDEEDNFPVSVAKVTPFCKAEKQKYQKEVQSNLCVESLHTFPQLPRDICEQMSKKKCGKTNKVECVVEDCKFQDEEWNMNTKDCISQQQPNSLMSPEGITKKSYHLNDKARYTYDSNKRRQSDGQEHCSRMAANPVQSVLYPPRSHNYRDQLVCNTGKENSQISQKLMKAKTQKSLQKQSTCGLNTKTSSLGGLEINIEYDTEDEENPFSTDQFMQRTKAHVLVDGFQTDQDGWSDCSSQSETIQFNKYRKGMKRQERVQDWKAELDGNNILPHSKNIQIAHGISSKDSGNKLSINKSMRAAQWDCAGKDWNGASRTSVLPGSTSETASAKNTRAGQLISDTESEATHDASSECCQPITPEKLSPSKHQSSELRRLFVALFDYDPLTMSPNPDSHEELPFKEGQIIQVFGDKDTDGFYQGECAGKVGYIPCNMVSEIYIESQDIRNELVKHGSLTSPTLLNELVQSTSVTEKKKIPVKSRRISKPEKSIPKAMEAIFDYNPKENSPNTDVEAELSFTAGDIITVYGPMDEDGFYYGELKGQRGLVPSNFLAVSQAETEGPIHQGEKESNFEDSMDETNSSLEDHISCNQASDSKATLQVQDMGQDITSSKKRKGFFSKGRKLFKKLGSSGKNL